MSRWLVWVSCSVAMMMLMGCGGDTRGLRVCIGLRAGNPARMCMRRGVPGMQGRWLRLYLLRLRWRIRGASEGASSGVGGESRQKRAEEEAREGGEAEEEGGDSPDDERKPLKMGIQKFQLSDGDGVVDSEDIAPGTMTNSGLRCLMAFDVCRFFRFARCLE